jgi:enoyl-CoA hydratase
LRRNGSQVRFHNGGTWGSHADPFFGALLQKADHRCNQRGRSWRGFGLVLAADIVISVGDARFGIPEVQRGIIGAGVVSRASTRLRPAAVLELALTGELIDAARAHELGVVNTITSRAELMPTAMRTAERIAANAPLAVAATKEVIFDVAALGRVDMPTLRAKFAYVATSADAKEGRRAFNERRPPVFRGE